MQTGFSKVKFGLFEFDMDRLELRKSGMPVRFPPQPAQILRLLLLQPGEPVSRERMREVLWPAGTHVEFELGLNTAVNRLRRALNDEADKPRYIETVPRTGYRFVGLIERIPSPAAVTPDEANLDPAAVLISPAPNSPSRYLPGWWIRIAAAILLVAAAWWFLQQRPLAQAAGRAMVPISLPAGGRIESLSIAPAGDHFAYVLETEGKRAVYRRFFKENFSRRVEGSDGAMRVFFPPDGRNLTVMTRSAMKMLSPDGTSKDLLATEGWDLASVIWAQDGSMLYSISSGANSGIWRMGDSKGPPQPFIPTETKPDGVEYVFARQTFGDRLLYSVRGGPKHNALRAYSQHDKRTWEVQDPAYGGLVGGGFLVFAKEQDLLAAPFDEKRMITSGPALRLVSGVAGRGWLGPEMAMTSSGLLVYLPAPPLEQRRIAWLKEDGSSTETSLPPGEYEQVRLSPVDGRLLALVVRESLERWTALLVNLETESTSRLLSTSVMRPRLTWAPDGHSLVIGSEVDNGDLVNLYRVEVGREGSLVRLTEQPNFGQFPLSWSAVHQELIFSEGVHPATRSDLKVYSFKDRSVRPLVTSPGWDTDAQFSPDGHWIAYASDSDGSMGVYVQPYPNEAHAQPRRVATGRCPIWLRDGDRLLYCDGGKLFQVAIRNGTEIGKPHLLLTHGVAPFDIWTRQFDAAADGRIIAIIRPKASAAQARIGVVEDVGAEYRRLSGKN